MIHVFHGFLGSAADFHFIQRPNLKIHNLYTMEKHPEINSDDILIGYSMGGRIALDLAHRVHYQLKKMVLINSHPGLQTNSEKEDRIKFEEKVLDYLKTKPRDEFLNWWNSLPLFSSDIPITCTDEIYNLSYELFTNHRLSSQMNHLPQMIEQKDKILYIVGLSDDKYMDLASELLLPYEFSVKGIAGGHRLFQKKDELMSILMDEGII